MSSMYRLFYAYPLWADHPRGYRFILRKLLRFFDFCKAIRTINRTIFTGLERNFCFSAAVGANCGKHFPLWTGIVFTCITAGFAALRLIYEASFSIEFLFSGCENKLRPTFFTCQCLVSVHFGLPRLNFWIYPLELRRPRLISSSANRCQRVYMQSLYGTVTK